VKLLFLARALGPNGGRFNPAGQESGRRPGSLSRPASATRP